MRLFVGLDLPSALRMRLSGLAGGVPGARWSPPENYHLTLRFIGEVQAWQAQEIDDALAGLRVRAFDLMLSSVGVFAKAGRAHTLWVGVERNDALEHLQSKIETALQRAGFEPERRRFTPHITIARLPDDVPEARLAMFVQAHSLFRPEPMTATHFTLFSSHLGKDAPVYLPEVDYALAGSDNAVGQAARA